MKKSLLLVGAMIFVASVSDAQTLIPKAGITLSNMALEDYEGMKLNTGLTFGIGYNIAVSDLFSIQPELNYIQKGLKGETRSTVNMNGYSTNYLYKEDFTINYLELPVLAKVTFGTNTKFYLNAGPSIAYGLDGKDKNEATTTTTYQGVTTTESDKMNSDVKFGDLPDDYDGEDVYVNHRLDFGAQFGGGAIIANKIIIDVRYGLGFSNLGNGEDEDYKSQHRVLQFTVGIPINLK